MRLIWASWDLINTVRAAFPESTVALDEDYRTVIAVGKIRVTFDRLGVSITRNGAQFTGLQVDATAPKIIAAIQQVVDSEFCK